MGRAWARWFLSPVCAFAAACSSTVVFASPWAEVGDRVLRSDIEVLAAHGLVGGLLTTWPIPWAHISSQLAVSDKAALPPYVRRSYERVRERLARETATHEFKSDVVARLSSEPALVRDFATTARGEFDTRLRTEYMGQATAFRLAAGFQGNTDNGGKFAYDDSYAAVAVGNWLAYGGVVDHWWGPGWISSLILSNNARPFPRVGFMRNDPKAFDLPVLELIGPWQLHGFVGVLDEDDRAVSDPLLLGFRLAINPLPGLELGASRTIQTCGDGRPCDFDTLSDAFLGRDNTGSAADPSNQLAGFDARLASSIAGQHFSLYGQIIGEDEAGQLPSKEIGLFGLSLWGPLHADGALWRLTSEYSDTTASFLNDDVNFNITYNHFIYETGFRYRGRSIGGSLDGDSRLLSLAGTVTDLRDRTYRLAYHHAEINRDGGGPQPVSRSAEKLNLVELGVSVPWPNSTFDVELRLQDDQPNTPATDDFEAAVEFAWTYRF